ncbi:mitochondrial import receptor subunit TOM22 homolog [Anneissia japonica]|uniref:mitochondrial import receptor subunit TOM22 homolog n=1 Tax=Anneissia japonica TaxID=1529436 RepID=UPI00142557E3|nr:mitochondrial import receptor subunit TOM22 homolog [Anneissia japonica]
MSEELTIQEVTDGSELEEDFEDETIFERICALSEMFPTPVRNITSLAATLSWKGAVGAFRFGRSATWIASTSFMILFLPIVFEAEMAQMEQAQLQHQRQILLGPNAASGGMPGFPAGLGPPGGIQQTAR